MSQDFWIMLLGIGCFIFAYWQYCMACGLAGKKSMPFSALDSFSQGKIISQLLGGVILLGCVVYRVVLKLLLGG